ncbi:microsomal glutathione S-transferase 2-like isoform X2 [Sycon ciliatum]|uniref:microsomal glutathione S-transferase 2-like isoform X2 n=1 Tax=Sycon ciliatum TaxID=27933 RepID=UPI0020AA3604
MDGKRQVARNDIENITPPRMDGPDEFNRVMRAYMNCVEFLPLFLSCIWVNSLFCHQAISLVLGLLYVYTRHQYFLEYCKAAKAREAPFRQSILITRVLAYSAMAGIALTAVKAFAGLDIAQLVTERVRSLM